MVPCLVVTEQPSISGSRSRCTPSRDTSAPPTSPRLATLSISSIKIMPVCSAAATAWLFRSSRSISLAASSSASNFSASRTDTLRGLPPCLRLANMPCSCWVISSMPGGAMMSTLAVGAFTSTSTSRSSRSPSRSFFRRICRVLLLLSSRPGGSSRSSRRSSAASDALVCTLPRASSRRRVMAVSTRSLTMDSTSLPT